MCGNDVIVIGLVGFMLLELAALLLAYPRYGGHYKLPTNTNNNQLVERYLNAKSSNPELHVPDRRDEQ